MKAKGSKGQRGQRGPVVGLNVNTRQMIKDLQIKLIDETHVPGLCLGDTVHVAVHEALERRKPPHENQ